MSNVILQGNNSGPMTDDGIMSWLSLSFWSDPPSCNYKGNQSYKQGIGS